MRRTRLLEQSLDRPADIHQAFGHHEEGLADALGTGNKGGRPGFLDLLAEVPVAVEASGREELLAETYCLQGEWLWRQVVPDMVQAGACFQQALATARRQQAKSWELRAATSLSHL